MTAPEERVRIETGSGGVAAAFGSASTDAPILVLAHGAGGDMDSAFLTGFARGLNDAGTATLRFNFPYAERGRRSPDPEAALRGSWVAAFEHARRTAGEGLVLAGGKSMGGRIASLCVASGDIDPAGLVFLGYPLHPPGRPERIRDAHLYEIEAPMLFVQGTKDPFARPELLERVLRRLGSRAEYHAVEGGDHSFRVRGAPRDDRAAGASLAPIVAEFAARTRAR
jgi:uncharacterized protein